MRTSGSSGSSCRLDDLERALGAAERHEEARVIEGVKLVEQSLRSALVKEGLVEISTD